MSVKRIGVHPDERRKSLLMAIGKSRRSTSSEADIEKEIYEMIIKYFVR